MPALPWAPEFDLGEYLGIGLSTNQIAHLAGALVLGLFGLSALRHAKQAGGIWPVAWIAIALLLLAGTLLVVANGFPESIPEVVKPWTDADRLARLVAVLALLGCSLVLISAHWVRGGMAKFGHRVAGLAVAACAVWLAAGWFEDQIPDVARPWTTRDVLVRAVLVLSLGFLAVAFWGRGRWASPHIRWLNRSLAPLALAFALSLAIRWFGLALLANLPLATAQNVLWTLALIACTCCLAIAAGAWFLRERPAPKRTPEPFTISLRPTPLPPNRLPVATLLDDAGRPIVPSQSVPRGPAGA